MTEEHAIFEQSAKPPRRNHRQERLKAAFSSESLEKVGFFSGTTFFSAMSRLPVVLTVNKVLLDIGIFSKKNIIASLMTTLIIPLSTVVGGLVREYFEADPEMRDRAEAGACKAVSKLGVLLEQKEFALGELPQVEINNTPEGYRKESYLAEVLDGTADITTSLQSLFYLKTLIEESVNHIDDTVHRDSCYLDSNQLEKMTLKLNHVFESKVIENGQLMNTAPSGERVPLSDENIIQIARDAVVTASQFVDLSTSQAIMEAEKRCQTKMHENLQCAACTLHHSNEAAIA